MRDLSSGVPDAGSTITVAMLTAPPRKRTASVLTVPAGMAFLIQVVLVDVEGGRSPRWVTENSVPDIPDIPDGLVHLIHGVADLAARGVIAH